MSRGALTIGFAVMVVSACGSAEPSNELQATNAIPLAGVTMHVSGPNMGRTIALPSDPGVASRTVFEDIAFSSGDELTFTAMLGSTMFAERTCTVSQTAFVTGNGIIGVIVDYSQTDIICTFGFEL